MFDWSYRRGGYPQIDIIVVSDSDYARASEILLKMGAAADKPVPVALVGLINRVVV